MTVGLTAGTATQCLGAGAADRQVCWAGQGMMGHVPSGIEWDSMGFHMLLKTAHNIKLTSCLFLDFFL